MKLNLGAGYKRFEGYTNVDFDAHCDPDVICDLEHDTWPFDDNSVTDVIAHHIIEHLGDGYFHFMQELYRVCAPSALIDIVVPHHRHDVFMNDPTHKRPITVDGLRMFSKSFNQYCVEIGDGTSKLGIFYDVDFDLIDLKFIFDAEYQHLITGEMTQEKQQQIQQIARERNNVIIETWVKLVAVKE